jgi:hypothetical protein
LYRERKIWRVTTSRDETNNKNFWWILVGKVKVQDNRREIQIATLLGLLLAESRIEHDATDDRNNLYELKTTTKGSVSTARDFGPKHIERYRKRYFVIVSGENLVDGFLAQRAFFLAPCHMETWYSKMQAEFDRHMRIHEAAIAILKAASFDPECLSLVGRDLYDGMLMNDPNIPRSYLSEHGIEFPIDATLSFDPAAASRLRELVELYPIYSAATTSLTA